MCSEIKNISIKQTWKVFCHELAHHFPYATLSVACSLMFLSLFNFFASGSLASGTASSEMDILFHSFHFIHILFSVSGTMVMFYRYSQNVLLGIVVGIISSTIFCTLSDILLPYVAGGLLGIPMDLHICFHSELANIIPFLFVGVLNGVVMFYVREFKTEYNSLFIHFFHTFISALASIFYALGHGLSDFYGYFGSFFILMLIAVVLPCTLSDVVVPIICARLVRKS